MSRSSDNAGPQEFPDDERDTLAYKDAGREIERVKKAVEEATDIREERVAAMKLALKKGKLQLNGDELAEKLLADPFHQVNIDV